MTSRIASMIEEAKAERTTLANLGCHAIGLSGAKPLGNGQWQLTESATKEQRDFAKLAAIYEQSVIRLNAIIKAAEASEQVWLTHIPKPLDEVCKEHACFKPCFVCWKQANGITD